MLRTVFNAFFTEMYSNKKEFVCLKFSQISKHSMIYYCFLFGYIYLFLNIDILKSPYIFSSDEAFLLFGLWILITYYAFFPILIFWTFVDKSKIELDISMLSSNIKINRHLFYVLFGCFIIFIKLKFIDFLYINVLIFIVAMMTFFIFLFLKISSINYFLFIMPLVFYFYANFICFEYDFVYLVMYFLCFSSIFIYNKILIYIKIDRAKIKKSKLKV